MHSMRADVKRHSGLAISLLMLVGALARAEGSARTSEPIGVVLREPLPAEDLALSTDGAEWVIQGPTFVYRVRRSSGTISSLKVLGEDRDLIVSSSPLDVRLDQYRLAADLDLSGAVEIAEAKDQIVLRAKGVLRDPAQRTPVADCSLVHTFFNDGVVVTEVKLTPRRDLPVEKTLMVEFRGLGQFSRYLHKRRDEHGESAVRGSLPEAKQTVRFATLTSCLQVFSSSAVLALFTDCGATHLSRTNLDTAAVEVINNDTQNPQLSLSQYLVHVAPGDKPYVLKGGEELSFRVGLSVGPNRIAHRRMHDLRMFAWIGDAKYPYPTDAEVEQVARAGYTVFQMHRLGTPGEPRPPAHELERVIKKVHDAGMLFLWTENADLMYDSAPGVQELKTGGQWQKWKGPWPDPGHYTATMDPYCDLVSTCMASPNGLADYRLATIRRMMERHEVDGIYLDDNLAYPGCQLGREHGHPGPVYDCLIELHEMNWKRRQLLRSKCPHQVLVTHNTKAIIQPVICDFDAVLYGEGYSFGSLQNYWDYYQAVKGMPAQGMIWPGGVDPARCAASVAYNFDLLTGGGQYCYIDWRLFPKKFPHAAGVTDEEHLYVQTYNLAEYYFGLYESKPYYFADSAAPFRTSTPQTYATIYRNQTWGDWLIAVANMSQESQKTSLEMRSPQTLGFEAQRTYLLFDTHLRTARRVKGDGLNQALKDILIPGQALQLYGVRELPSEGAWHVWGGKRITEAWDAHKRTLTLMIQGPAGLQDTLFLGCAGQRVSQIEVGGKKEAFLYDPVQDLIHGQVTFTSQPLKVELICSTNTINEIAESPVTPDALGQLSGAR